MVSFLKTVTLLILSTLFTSCGGKTQNIQSENDKIFEVFNQWEKKVLRDSTYLIKCPSVDDFESINDTARVEKLSRAHILPESYTVSFGDFNGDKKMDAIFSFPDYTCYSNYIGREPTNGYNRTGSFILVTSTFDGYKNSTDEIETNMIANAIQRKFKASNVSISIEKIEGEDLISGTCKIWVDSGNKDFLGDCCPNYLLFITINNAQRKLSAYINENESEAFDISF